MAPDLMLANEGFPMNVVTRRTVACAQARGKTRNEHTRISEVREVSGN